MAWFGRLWLHDSESDSGEWLANCNRSSEHLNSLSRFSACPASLNLDIELFIITEIMKLWL